MPGWITTNNYPAGKNMIPIPLLVQEHPTSCSAEKLFYNEYFAGKTDPVLCVAGKMKHICWQTFFRKLFVKWALSPPSGEILFRTLDNLWKFAEIMDVRDETHIIHSCYVAGWEKYWCHLPVSEEHLFIYQGRQLRDDKQAPSLLIHFKLIVRCF